MPFLDRSAAQKCPVRRVLLAAVTFSLHILVVFFILPIGRPFHPSHPDGQRRHPAHRKSPSTTGTWAPKCAQNSTSKAGVFVPWDSLRDQLGSLHQEQDVRGAETVMIAIAGGSFMAFVENLYYAALRFNWLPQRPLHVICTDERCLRECGRFPCVHCMRANESVVSGQAETYSRNKFMKAGGHENEENTYTLSRLSSDSQKKEYIVKTLRRGNNVLLTDLDVGFANNPLRAFKPLSDPSWEIQFSYNKRVNRRPLLNIGAVLLRSTPEAIDFGQRDYMLQVSNMDPQKYGQKFTQAACDENLHHNQNLIELAFRGKTTQPKLPLGEQGRDPANPALAEALGGHDWRILRRRLKPLCQVIPETALRNMMLHRNSPWTLGEQPLLDEFTRPSAGFHATCFEMKPLKVFIMRMLGVWWTPSHYDLRGRQILQAEIHLEGPKKDETVIGIVGRQSLFLLIHLAILTRRDLLIPAVFVRGRRVPVHRIIPINYIAAKFRGLRLLEPNFRINMERKAEWANMFLASPSGAPQPEAGFPCDDLQTGEIEGWVAAREGGTANEEAARGELLRRVVTWLEGGLVSRGDLCVNVDLGRLNLPALASAPSLWTLADIYRKTLGDIPGLPHLGICHNYVKKHRCKRTCYVSSFVSKRTDSPNQIRSH
ncbi:unnamed protein product [Vitrella brassicaformis CCMP3155]|uniref:Nucleotide-diphospho-sugar transferase domain-containing protein n=1 Tax=Vitrella brassicaformis (strain CCMP3155) TaxID=1169540 RepID=A0A0G4GSY3_VITBC|nr:unnamed protein product [Vitrella brassicaformis CCMP3155]|eukprot:CEM33816.1 unnamed protein product [Vitrella brassicaformis CCMP3155]